MSNQSENLECCTEQQVQPRILRKFHEFEFGALIERTSCHQMRKPSNQMCNRFGFGIVLQISRVSCENS